MASMAQGSKDMLERDMDFYEAITCVFNFKEHELVVYMDLCSHPRSTVDEIAERLHRDRSWVHRALSTLLHLGMVQRYRRLLAKGGYIYQYQGLPAEQARNKLKDSLGRWCAGMVEQIDRSLVECVPEGTPPEPKAQA